MAAHHVEQCGNVGRTVPARDQDVADLGEVVGPEDAGCGDREELGVDRSHVDELVDLAASNADRIAGADLASTAVDREREDAFQAVDGLVEGVVAVGRRNLGPAVDCALEDGRGATGIGRLDKEADLDPAEVDGGSGRGLHGDLQLGRLLRIIFCADDSSNVKGMATTPKRPYDARRRRERATEERSATRRRVVAAARDLFLQRGYVATTMADIAREAGVALQSVYTAGQSKADLLHLVTDLAVAGDSQEVMLADRPEYAAVASEPDPRRQVGMLAALTAATMERLAPVWIAYREAAVVDPKAGANLVAAHRRRHETFRALVRMVPEQHLRNNHDQSADTAWAIGSIDVFLLLRTILEWDAPQYAEWLRETLVDQLVAPSG